MSVLKIASYMYKSEHVSLFALSLNESFYSTLRSRVNQKRVTRQIPIVRTFPTTGANQKFDWKGRSPDYFKARTLLSCKAYWYYSDRLQSEGVFSDRGWVPVEPHPVCAPASSTLGNNSSGRCALHGRRREGNLTLAPFFSSSSQYARPMPAAPPVTMATLPLMSIDPAGAADLWVTVAPHW